MLPIEILDLLENDNGVDSDFCITQADFSGDIPFVKLDSKLTNQSWRIKIYEHRTNKITFGHGEIISIEDDHPILWPYTDTQCSLYFNGKPKEIGSLFADLFQTHYALFNDLIPFYRYINAIGNLSRLLDAGHGLLANGAKQLLHYYANSVEKHGVEFSIINERPPSYWNGQVYIPEDKNLKVLFIGQSFIVAEDFAFQAFT